MKKQNKLTLKNASIKEENEKVSVVEYKKDIPSFSMNFEELCDDIKKLGNVKLAISSEDALDSDSAIELLKLFVGKVGINLQIVADEEY
ncbi:hypothetical protein [uncultured Clostridium sp.]|uniref:hypothetical protein n=1 Tax=uncultured Clostridium sp. TaxID=59620 RepID=UPI0026DBD3A0|nr:hypothetical protein [uncultured Clostridium sp.]